MNKIQQKQQTTETHRSFKYWLYQTYILNNTYYFQGDERRLRFHQVSEIKNKNQNNV